MSEAIAAGIVASIGIIDFVIGRENYLAGRLWLSATQNLTGVLAMIVALWISG